MSGEDEIDDRQGRIAAWLQEKRPDLASMYLSALSLLGSPAQSGDERTRVAHVCHAMRELMNRLPEALGVEGFETGGPRSSTLIQDLPGIVARFPGLDLVLDAENVPVPHELALFLDSLIRTAILEDDRVLGNMAALLTDDGSTKHLAVREWRELSKFFTKWAHLHAKQANFGEIPSDAELIKRIGAVEDLMEGLLAEFFYSLHAVHDLLAEANRLTEGSEGA